MTRWRPRLGRPVPAGRVDAVRHDGEDEEGGRDVTERPERPGILQQQPDEERREEDADHRDDVREVAAGFECGIKLKNYNEIKEGDQLEFFEVKEVARTL